MVTPRPRTEGADRFRRARLDHHRGRAVARSGEWVRTGADREEGNAPLGVARLDAEWRVGGDHRAGMEGLARDHRWEVEADPSSEPRLPGHLHPARRARGAAGVLAAVVCGRTDDYFRDRVASGGGLA